MKSDSIRASERFRNISLMYYLDIIQTHEYSQILSLWKDGNKPYQIAEELGVRRAYIYKIMQKLALIDDVT